MKKWIPLILVIFLIGCGQDLRSDEMHREAQRPWAELFGSAIRGGGFGSCNMSSCSFSPYERPKKQLPKASQPGILKAPSPKDALLPPVKTKNTQLPKVFICYLSNFLV